MDFFSDCKSQEEAKETFRRLCKCFHPDRGGEESLMVELKRQYDAWPPSYQPHHLNFTVHSSGLSSIYENKINELNRIIYQLRQEAELLRIHAAFDKDAYNAEARKNRKLQEQMNELNEQLQKKKDELAQEHERIKNMSLGEKIKKVFGYE